MQTTTGLGQAITSVNTDLTDVTDETVDSSTVGLRAQMASIFVAVGFGILTSDIPRLPSRAWSRCRRRDPGLVRTRGGPHSRAKRSNADSSRLIRVQSVPTM
jgi:hypothetical protein